MLNTNFVVYDQYMKLTKITTEILKLQTHQDAHEISDLTRPTAPLLYKVCRWNKGGFFFSRASNTTWPGHINPLY